MKNYHSIGLRAARAALNITQQQVAEASGLSVNTIANAEKGKGFHYNTYLTLHKTYSDKGVEISIYENYENRVVVLVK